MGDDSCCFPEEIIFEILTRVPAKDLIRFKAVCKPWCFLISDRKFVKAHLHWASRACAQLEVLLRPVDYSGKISGSRHSDFLSIKIQDLHFQTERLKSCPFEEDLEKGNVKLHDSCNGLLLFEKSGGVDTRTLILYNPVTRQCKNVPCAPRQDWMSRNLIALLHDEFSERYKIFSIVSKPQYTAYGTCFIFTVGDDTLDDDWEMFEFEVTTKPDTNFDVCSPLFFFENELCWMTIGDEDYYDDKYFLKEFDLEEFQESLSLNLLSINVATNSFKRAKLLTSMEFLCSRTSISLSKVNGYLCMIVVYEDHIDVIRIYQNEANHSWTAPYRICLQSVPFLINPCYGTYVVVVSTTPNREDEDLLNLIKIFIHHEDQFFLYDLKNKALKQIGPLSKEYSLYDYDPPKCHFDSLVIW